jgi:Fe-S-cluster containining protein
MTFACSGCGACCRAAADAGLVPTRDGHCVHLTDDQQCAIYATRPEICDVAATHARQVGQGLQMTQATYFTLSTHACHALMDRYDIEPRFRLDPSRYTHADTMRRGGQYGP